jgi:hypothetical protein
MTDIAADVATVRAWETTAKPGELPPIDVHAAALRIQNHLAPRGAGPPRVESAIDKFKRTVREDTPPMHPNWDPALAGNSQPKPGERAVDKFRRQRLANNQEKMS